MHSYRLTNGDVDISNGKINIVAEEDLIIQNLKMNMQTRKSEWFLNNQKGLEFEPFFNKLKNFDEMSTAIIESASQIEGFGEFRSINFELNARVLSISFTGILLTGFEFNETEVIIF